MAQFREVVIQSACRIKLRNHNLLFESVDGVSEISLNQLNSLVIDTKQCLISQPALVALNQANITLVLTDDHHQPVASFQQDALLRQFAWKDKNINELWQVIIHAKMRHQIDLACLDYQIPVMVSDSDEALLAKRYFHTLFGDDFRRDFKTGDVNSALNYGYMLLTSRLATEIAAHGYSPAIGIHHHSNSNPMNLACDFVEPWRIVVDQYVDQHQHEVFNALYRQNLVDLLNLPISYNGTNYETVLNALQAYVNNCLKVLNGDLLAKRIEVQLLDHATISHV